MKITTKILHLLWAAFWSYLLLWMLLTGASWSSLSYRPVQEEVAMAALALFWFLIAIALFFERRWAWYGSLVFTVFSLLGTLYIVFDSIFLAPSPARGGFVLESVGAFLLPMIVLAMLMFTRHHFLRPHDKAD